VTTSLRTLFGGNERVVVRETAHGNWRPLGGRDIGSAPALADDSLNSRQTAVSVVVDLAPPHQRSTSRGVKHLIISDGPFARRAGAES
jgi:hypothetical protein